MAFTMKHGMSPFHQDQKPARLEKPVEPDYNAPEYQGFGTEQVPVVSGRASNRTIRQTARGIKNLGTGINGNITTTPAYTRSSGSMLGALIGKVTGNEDSDYYKVVDKGTASVKGEQTNALTSEESSELAKKVKAAMKSGQNVQISGTEVTTGGEVMEERKYDKKKRAQSDYNKANNAYLRQENQDKEAARLAGIKAERAARLAEQAATRTRNAEAAATKQAQIKSEREAREKINAENRAKNAAAAEAKKNKGKQPATNESTTTEPVAQQNRSAFYQKGMLGDKMDLQNKNKKVSATSPLNQNSATGEKLIGSKTTVEKGSLGSRPGTFTTTTNDYETPGNGNTKTKEKMSNEDWSKFVKENPDWNKGSNRSDSNKSFKPDLEKPMDLPTPAPTTFGNGLTSQPIKPIPTPVTPKEEPKKPTVTMAFGGKKEKSMSGGSGSGSYSNGGSGTTCGCH